MKKYFIYSLALASLIVADLIGIGYLVLDHGFLGASLVGIAAGNVWFFYQLGGGRFGR